MNLECLLKKVLLYLLVLIIKNMFLFKCVEILKLFNILLIKKFG